MKLFAEFGRALTRRAVQIEVFCYALSPPDGSEWRQRIEAQVEHFTDVTTWTTQDIARAISADGIQVAINLNGYTKVTQAFCCCYISHLQSALATYTCPQQLYAVETKPPNSQGSRYVCAVQAISFCG